MYINAHPNKNKIKNNEGGRDDHVKIQQISVQKKKLCYFFSSFLPSPPPLCILEHSNRFIYKKVHPL